MAPLPIVNRPAVTRVRRPAPYRAKPVNPKGCGISAGTYTCRRAACSSSRMPPIEVPHVERGTGAGRLTLGDGGDD